MEVIIAIIAVILVFMFIKYLFKKFLACIFILIFAGIIGLIYRIPYNISVFSISILLYSIKSVFLELKYMGRNLVKPRRFYLNGGYEKIVALLFSLNYVIFMILCYTTLMNKSFYILDIIDLCIAFCLTWICIWIVDHVRNIFLNYVNTKTYEV